MVNKGGRAIGLGLSVNQSGLKKCGRAQENDGAHSRNFGHSASAMFSVGWLGVNDDGWVGFCWKKEESRGAKKKEWKHPRW